MIDARTLPILTKIGIERSAVERDATWILSISRIQLITITIVIHTPVTTKYHQEFADGVSGLVKRSTISHPMFKVIIVVNREIKAEQRVPMAGSNLGIKDAIHMMP